MTNEVRQQVHETNLLRVMLQIREWEDGQLPELHTISGRNLYFRITASYNMILICRSASNYFMA